MFELIAESEVLLDGDATVLDFGRGDIFVAVDFAIFGVAAARPVLLHGDL